MLVLLPPSETKSAGGDGPPLDVDALSFTSLNPVRRKLVDALSELAADLPASRKALGISERQDGEIERNAELWSAPTMSALRRYTGVLYDAMDLGGFGKPQLAKAGRRLAVASALFGLVRADDPIPAYRLSAGSTIPAVGGLRPLWRPALRPVLDDVDGLMVDLRSGGYAALCPTPGAVTVRVVTQGADGVKRTVSHFNKAYKGALAGALVRAPREPSTVDGLLRIAHRAGLDVEQTGAAELELRTGD